MPALRFRVKICLNRPLTFSVVLRQTECLEILKKKNAYNFRGRGPT